MDQPTTTGRLRTVAELARITGVTVRTLHHYDAIGLLVPGARSDAEYRLYDDTDLARLREILVWRRLDVPLAEIARLLDDPSVDRGVVLRSQLELVRARRGELDALAEALERAVHEHDAKEQDMATDQAIIDALGGFDPADHEPEARERWGDTDAYRESAHRTKAYTADDWKLIKAEGDAITERLGELFDAGAEPTGDDVLEQAEEWRGWISRWFYECGPLVQRGLGEMFVADPRFTRTYEGADGARSGMAAWMRTAFAANADRLEAG